MPAHIGFAQMMKIPLGFLYQLAPTKGAAEIRSMGIASPLDIYKGKLKTAESRDRFVRDYVAYRKHLDQYEPAKAAKKGTDGQKRMTPVDASEWDLYLKPDTTFDKAVRTILDRQEGWTIDLVTRKSDAKALKRIEAKRGKGHMSITMWSCNGSANGRLFD